MTSEYPKKNYIFEFKGWVQCRVPTDPDPHYEPRGVTGYTFAVPGEPDLDQIIYFQNKDGVVRRSYCPKVGVYVTGGWEYNTVGSNGEERFTSKRPIKEGHPYYHAKVDLPGKPRFDSRNGTIIYNGFGIINPFGLSIEGKDGQCIYRRFYADPDNPQEDLSNYPIELLTKYECKNAIMDCVGMLLDADVLQRSAFRNERLENLQKEYADTKDAVKRAGLEKRISELKNNDPVNRRTNQIGTKALFNYPLNAKTAMVNDAEITPDQDWLMDLWLGGWDADALGFYIKGYVQVVLNK